jgi:hypothetical protein
VSWGFGGLLGSLIIRKFSFKKETSLASMSQRAMPFIFLNMAGEMAYILEQRLIVSSLSGVYGF